MLIADALGGDSPTVWTIIAFVIAQVIQSLYMDWRTRRAAEALKKTTEEKADELKDALDVKQVEDSVTRDKLLRSSNAAAANAKASLQVNVGNKERLERMSGELNGDGIGGKLKEMGEWMFNHEKLDADRHQELTAGHVDLKRSVSEVTEAVKTNSAAIQKLTAAKELS